MKFYFSKEAQGLYHGSLFGDENLPADAKEISGEVYEVLKNGREGMVIDWDDLPPKLIPAPPPPTDILAAAARATRDSLLSSVYDRQILLALRELRMTAPENVERVQQINSRVAELDAYAKALQDVPAQEGFPESIAWPQEPGL
ncbi:phage tail assembly chaperone [Pseudomonas taiwanensis]|uniref:phage tail assembly chaperone n=1 Tax=Pseudomonas taiwanensis TaxID=470150 RepID=UPI0016480746|nr:phage tail assembly chaperone [Pseudomonas taiwanensis]MBC3492728.1 hypothetical protein [Pseudomonas taiwanensis]